MNTLTVLQTLIYGKYFTNHSRPCPRPIRGSSIGRKLQFRSFVISDGIVIYGFIGRGTSLSKPTILTFIFANFPSCRGGVLIGLGVLIGPGVLIGLGFLIGLGVTSLTLRFALRFSPFFLLRSLKNPIIKFILKFFCNFIRIFCKLLILTSLAFPYAIGQGGLKSQVLLEPCPHINCSSSFHFHPYFLNVFFFLLQTECIKSSVYFVNILKHGTL